MSAQNNCSFIGRLGKDAESRWTPNEKQITNFSVAVDIGWGNNKKTMWLNVGAWGQWVDNVVPHLRKGVQVCVLGEIELREYEKDGVTKQSLQLTIQPGGVKLLSKVEGGQSQQSGGGGYRSKPKQEAAPKQGELTGNDFKDDDIPF
jgi:single-strand DNA-binding protein